MTSSITLALRAAINAIAIVFFFGTVDAKRDGRRLRATRDRSAIATTASGSDRLTAAGA